MQHRFLYTVKAAADFFIPLFVINLLKPTTNNCICPQIKFCQFFKIFLCHIPIPEGEFFILNICLALRRGGDRTYSSSVTQPSLAVFTTRAYLYKMPFVALGAGCFH